MRQRKWKWEHCPLMITWPGLCFLDALCLTFNLWWERESESESIVFEKWESESESVVLRSLRGRSLLPVLLPCATCSWELLGQCPVIVSLMSARLGRLVGQGRRVQRLSCIWLSKRAVDKRRKEKHGWSYAIVYSPVMIVSDGLLRASIPGKLKKLPCASWKLAFYG